jgi:probable addiction module antidote protein
MTAKRSTVRRRSQTAKATKKLSFKVMPLDVSEFLDNEEVIAEYLSLALDDPNPQVFLDAVANVAKARGMTKVAQDAGLTRASLYKTFASGAQPKHETIAKVLKSLGVHFKVAANT